MTQDWFHSSSYRAGGWHQCLGLNTCRITSPRGSQPPHFALGDNHVFPPSNLKALSKGGSQLPRLRNQHRATPQKVVLGPILLSSVFMSCAFNICKALKILLQWFLLSDSIIKFLSKLAIMEELLISSANELPGIRANGITRSQKQTVCAFLFTLSSTQKRNLCKQRTGQSQVRMASLLWD